MRITGDRPRGAFVGLCGAALLAELQAPVSSGAEVEPDPRVRPGATTTFEFPDFGKTWDGQEIATMQVYIPTDYSLDRRFPLLAWFGGGYGGSSADTPRRITGGAEVKAILSMSGWQRSSKLGEFLRSWKGYPVYQEALDAFEKDAAKAFAALGRERPSARTLRLFVEKWSPAPSAERAQELLEEAAREELAKILGGRSSRSKRSKLRSFGRSYAGTKAAEEARKALLALLEDEAQAVLAGIKRRTGHARKSMLRSFLRTYPGTEAAGEAKRLLEEMTGGG